MKCPDCGMELTAIGGHLNGPGGIWVARHCVTCGSVLLSPRFHGPVPPVTIALHDVDSVVEVPEAEGAPWSAQEQSQ